MVTVGPARCYGSTARRASARTHRTTDQTFVLRTLIESARARKVPLFTCFVDFKKAYDTIPRDKLWEKLRRIGVSDEFVQAVQALYAEVPMGVQLPSGLSDTFMSELGVKQGCPLSPTLFGIFIDDFQTELEARAAGFSLPTLVGKPTPALFYATTWRWRPPASRVSRRSWTSWRPTATTGASPST